MITTPGTVTNLVSALLLILVLFATFTQAAGNLKEIIKTEALGGAERYLAYLGTDKPVYREGEAVYFRTVFLNANNNTPISSGRSHIQIKITGPNGDTIHAGSGADTGSAIGYKWLVPDGAAGGEYTATVTSNSMGTAATKRKFEVRAYRVPRINTQIEFARDGYGAGENVNASVTMTRAEGGLPEGAEVTTIARVDGAEIYRSQPQLVTNNDTITVSFLLPDTIETGEGNLSFVVDDGGVIETASKTLPILQNTIEIEFYPEGGDLVATLPNRVYFQAQQPNGKPADITGHIIEHNASGDTIVAKIESEHEGRGRFVFTPQPDKRYSLVVTQPTGITHPIKLPAAIAVGTVISSNKDVFEYSEDIAVSVASTKANSATQLTLHKREALIDSGNIKSGLIKLDGKDAEGVLIVTAWNSAGRPVAERLVFRKPRFGLNVDIKLSEGPYVAGGNVSIDILTSDDNGQPVEAVVGLTVTDDSVLELIEKREQAPRLPVMVYLENEVQNLEDAHVYLDNTNPQSAPAIDLLLGTQGWRRFVLIDHKKIREQYPEEFKRILAENKPVVVAEKMQRRLLKFNANAMPEMFAVQADAAIEMEALPAAMPPVMDLALANEPGDNRLEAAPVRMDNMARAKPAGLAPGAELNQGIAADRVDEQLFERLQNLSVRKFAFQVRPNRKPNDRVDFSETLYWHSGIKTSPRDGRATVKFDLSDNVTTFAVMADAYGRNGALASGDNSFTSLEPFYISTKMPLRAVVGDIIELPVTLINNSTDTLNNTRIRVKGDGVNPVSISEFTLHPGQRSRTLVQIEATTPGLYSITVNAQAGPYSDNVTRTLSIGAKGFPQSFNKGGLLSPDSAFAASLTLPPDVLPGSVTTTAKIYPSPLANMEAALSALLRQPHGCFEQASSSNYPLVMAQQYFQSHSGVDPALITKSRELLKVGYKKLLGFESQDNGYEWFGANPAHEALTAYGLMEFSDMAKVMPVDSSMIQRTRQWLLDRRDGNGGFKRNNKALDSFGRAPAPTTNAYIVWSLLESGEDPSSLSKEIEAIKKQALSGTDSYVDALTANILFISGDISGANIFAKKLSDSVSDNGAVDGAATSITASGGDSLTIETTSLALLAWLRDDEQWAAQVEHSIKWLFERAKSGRFGSTQSTVLALKAINAYDAARAAPKTPGSVQLYIDDRAFGKPLSFTTDSQGAIELPDFSVAMTPGQHNVELRMQDGSKMPFSIEVSYNTTQPSSAETTPVIMSTTISHSTITEGEPTEMRIVVTTANKDVATPIAIIGLPAGTEIRHDQLQELVAKETIGAYETRDSGLVLYWRALEKDTQHEVLVELIAAIPGTYTAAASRIYPYYSDEQKLWVAGHSINITAR